MSFRFQTLLFIGLIAGSAALARESPVLVRDLNPYGAFPAEITAAGARTFFASRDVEHGDELWVHEGGRSRLVADLEPGAADFGPSDLTAIGNLVYFRGRRARSKELWVSDGTAAGTRLVFVSPDSGGSIGIEGIRAAGSRLFLRVWRPDNRKSWHLFTTDGTTAGTQELPTGGEVHSFEHLGVPLTDGRFYFRCWGTSGGPPELWISDGTTAGTQRLTENIWVTSALCVVGSRVYFAGSHELFGGGELWASDGTPAGTGAVADIRPGAQGAGVFNLARLGNGVLFFANDGTRGMEPWISDGTAVGTRLVRDIVPGAGHGMAPNVARLEDLVSPPRLSHEDMSGSLASLGSRVLFVNQGVDTGAELWVTDGTAAGTHLVKDLRPGPSGSDPEMLTPIQGAILFLADGADSTGRELWISDGTATGTRLVRDLLPGPDASRAGDFTASGAGAYFRAFAGEGSKLWFTDGTAAGTHVVDDRFSTSFDALVGPLVASGGRVFFNLGEEGGRTIALWSTDGTATGTHRVLGPFIQAPDPGFVAYSAYEIYPLGDDSVLWTPWHPALNTELWYGGATATRSGLLMDFTALLGANYSWPKEFTRFGDDVYFTAATSSMARDWFRFRPATLKVEPVTITNDRAWLGPMVSGHSMYFMRPDRFGTTVPTRLFRTDGTPGSAVELAWPEGTPLSIAGISTLTEHGGRTYFNVERLNAYEVWRTTADGRAVEPVLPSRKWSLRGIVNGRLIFVGNDGLFGSDGTEGGTVRLAPSVFVFGNDGKRAFAFEGGTSPTASGILWVTDGTASGTRLVMRLPPGTWLMHGFIARDVAYFLINTNVDPTRELWRSDGTEEGTYRVHRDQGVGEVLQPNMVTATNDGTVFLVLRHPVFGRELFKIVPERASAGLARLTNLSVRARVAGPDRPLIVGFAVGGSAPSTVLARRWSRTT